MILWLLASLAAAAAPVPPVSSTQPCTARDAVRAAVVEIAGRPDHYLGRCVTVTGALAGISMYSGREGLYRAASFGRDGNPTPQDLRHRIGIDNDGIRGLRMRHPLRATVTGRVDTCEARSERVRRETEARGGIPIFMLTGYCHYHGGATIVVHAFQITEQGYERLSGEAARRDFGNLAFMPADWPQRAQIEALVADFLAALRAGDRAALAGLHDISPSTHNESDRESLARLLDSLYSPFAGFRRAAPPQTAIFVGGRGGAPLPPDGNVAARVCFCRTAECTGRWPISASDADAAEDRPYACTAIEPRDWTPRRAGFLTPAQWQGWLPEPAATAFRAAANGSTR